ncbi:nucleotidyltransferase domain-containing protein [Gorillibacterium timonense]|uniref:nucleotidyltransferase domain-containing protein n=1 Tax=Gorillibacterium timonense TaxID=1689269 RepID=UPI00071CA3E5|nr:nucleotidyltransferase family protein [Gorillibacterium timonense]
MKNLMHSDASELSVELQLTLLLLRSEPGKVWNAEERELFRQADWAHVMELARHHRVYPYLHRQARQLDFPAAPERVTGSLAREYRHNVFRMLHLAGEMETVSEQLDLAGVRSLMLKGPVLAHDLYGELSLRTSCDLDLLVEIEQLDRVERLLPSLGYVKDDYIETVLGDWKWRHHHITFYHAEKGIKLEVHWRLNPGPSSEPAFQELWQRRRQTPLATGYPVYYLGREDLFLFLASHGARHGWSRLRWLLDIDRLVRQGLDEEKLTSLLHKHRLSPVGGQALRLASVLLGTPLTAPLARLASDRRAGKLAAEAMFYVRQMLNLHTYPLTEEVNRYHRRHLFSLMAPSHKALFLLSLLYPFYEDARTLPLPERAHFLYFPLRPFLCVWRMARRFRYQEGGA